MRAKAAPREAPTPGNHPHRRRKHSPSSSHPLPPPRQFMPPGRPRRLLRRRSRGSRRGLSALPFRKRVQRPALRSRLLGRMATARRQATRSASPHGVEKSFVRAQSGQGRELLRAQGRSGRPPWPQRRRQDDGVRRAIYWHSSSAWRPGGASSSTATMSRSCRCTGSARGSASAICRRKPRPRSAASPSRTIFARCLKSSSPDKKRRARDLRRAARGIQHRALAQNAGDRVVRRRAAALRDRARAGDASELHAARRTVCRHRSDRRRRHSIAGAASSPISGRPGALITDHNVREDARAGPTAPTSSAAWYEVG